MSCGSQPKSVWRIQGQCLIERATRKWFATIPEKISTSLWNVKQSADITIQNNITASG